MCQGLHPLSELRGGMDGEGPSFLPLQDRDLVEVVSIRDDIGEGEIVPAGTGLEAGHGEAGVGPYTPLSYDELQVHAEILRSVMMRHRQGEAGGGGGVAGHGESEPGQLAGDSWRRGGVRTVGQMLLAPSYTQNPTLPHTLHNILHTLHNMPCTLHRGSRCCCRPRLMTKLSPRWTAEAVRR